MRALVLSALVLLSTPSARAAEVDGRHCPDPGAYQPSGGAMGILVPGGTWEALGVTPRLEPGRWVEYRVVDEAGQTKTLRFSVIPPERPLPEKRWRILEVRTVNPSGAPTVVKLLLTGSDFGSRGNLARIMIKQPGGRLMEVPLSRREPGDPVPEIVDEGVKVPEGCEQGQGRGEMKPESVSSEEMKVPAGTFVTRHVVVPSVDNEGRPRRAEFWTSPKVPVWGMVKVDTGRERWTLTALGAGAHSELPPFALEREDGPAKKKPGAAGKRPAAAP